MSDGRRRPPIEVGDVLIIVESDLEVTVTQTGWLSPGGENIEAIDHEGRRWLLFGWQVRHKPS